MCIRDRFIQGGAKIFKMNPDFKAEKALIEFTEQCAGRLHHAMNTVQAATRLMKLCRPSSFESKKEKVIQFCNEICPNVNANKDSFEFLVAGGFVVCEMLLGEDTWGDIDLWFVPQKISNDAWRVLAGCSTYPTNVLAVRHIYEALRSFDLDICQCAIHFLSLIHI